MLLHFEYLRLRADSLYGIINRPIELELVLTEDSALLAGSGYREAVSSVFQTLIPDWHAIIRLSDKEFTYDPGTYSLLFQDHLLFAWRDRFSFPIADGPVTIEVWHVPPTATVEPRVRPTE